MNNISDVVDSGFCIGCGACYVICPAVAITATLGQELHYPKVGAHCTQCGLCQKICPSIGIDYRLPGKSLTEALSGNEMFVAWAKDLEVRHNSTSGGFVTAYLLHLMDKGLIDGAIVATCDGPVKTIRACIATTPQEIKQAAGSKYYPIEICKPLKEIDKSKSYAVVGKGCDLSAIDRMEKLTGLKNIYIKIGLVCHHTPPAKITSEICKSMGFNVEEVTDFRFRAQGWPGKIRITDHQKTVEAESVMDLLSFFAKCGITSGCATCLDGFADKADIVVSDAWFLNRPLKQVDGGYSLVMLYTEKGKNEFEKIRSVCEIKPANKDQVLASNPVVINKNIAAFYKLMIFRMTRRFSPVHHLSRLAVFKIFTKYIFSNGFSFRKFLGALKFGVADHNPSRYDS